MSLSIVFPFSAVNNLFVCLFVCMLFENKDRSPQSNKLPQTFHKGRCHLSYGSNKNVLFTRSSNFYLKVYLTQSENATHICKVFNPCNYSRVPDDKIPPVHPCSSNRLQEIKIVNASSCCLCKIVWNLTGNGETNIMFCFCFLFWLRPFIMWTWKRSSWCLNLVTGLM